MSSSEKPTAAFALSLIAGILILINGAVLGAVGSFLGSFIMPLEPEVPGFVPSILYGLMAIGIILGIIIIIGAIMLYQKPDQKTGWGIAVLILSIISIFIGGGFLIGLILGIIGGALALRWKPKEA